MTTALTTPRGFTVNEDDIFSVDIGYDSSCIVFYQVVGFKGKKTVCYKELKNSIEFNHNGIRVTRPAYNNFVSDEIKTSRVYEYSNDAQIKVDDDYLASKYRAGQQHFVSER